MARRYEAAWLEEPIPVLAGHTPRECAKDPSRRPDLIRLLDSFRTNLQTPLLTFFGRWLLYICVKFQAAGLRRARAM